MTPERIEQERKAFEEWYASTYLPTPARGRTFNKYPSGVYCLQHAQDVWQARAALEKSERIENEITQIKRSLRDNRLRKDKALCHD